VSILGPGIVRQFQGEATIVVSGNTSYIQHVVVLSSCNDGIAVRGSNNNITANTVDLSNLSRLRGVGIVIVSGGVNLIQKNEVAGAADAISLVGSNNNFIKGNNASGVYSQSRGIVIESSSSGNQIQYNQALGNTAIDISDDNSPGANVYAHNLCSTSSVGHPFPGQNICEIIGIAGHAIPQLENDQ
jgi:parallel beta-helix repeat protein